MVMMSYIVGQTATATKTQTVFINIINREQSTDKIGSIFIIIIMYILTDSQIFSRSAWPYSVNKHFIIWPLTVKNFKNSVWTHKIRQPCMRAEQLYKSFYNKYLFYFSASNKELTIHWKTRFIFLSLFSNCNSC